MEGSEFGEGGVSNLLSQPSIPFFLPNMSENEWRSKVEFNSAGMQVVYHISNLTLNAIFPSYGQYLGYAVNYKDYLDPYNLSNVELQRLVWENKGPLAVTLCSVVFIILLTLWGFGWCCSKCLCGDKGCSCCNSRQPEDLVSAKLEQKRDKCKRNFCGVLFAAIIIAFMFGLVCCFVTNEQMRLSVEQMPEEVDDSLADVDIYLNTTERQINALFKDNYNLLSATLNHILDQSGEIIKEGLSKKTGAEALNNLTDILATVEQVRLNVLNVESSSKTLKDQVNRLENGLTDSKTRLLRLLDQCFSQKCTDLKRMPEIQSLRVQNDFQNALAMYYPKLPNMTDILRDLGLLLETDVLQKINEGKEAFNRLGIRIKTEVEPVLPEIRNMINDTGNELALVAKSLTRVLSSIPVDLGREKVIDLEVHINKYAPLRYYFGLGVCMTLTFIFTLLTLGIFVGFCGRQPGSDYSNECCSRKTGSSFINCGIFFMFLTGGVLIVAALTHFILAGALTQVICEAVYNQDNRTEEAFRLPKLSIDSRYNYKVPPYHEIIKECGRGSSAYNAFQLKSVYNIENITMLAERFKRKARKLSNEVKLPDDATDDIVFLSPEVKQQLRRFSRSKINTVKFDSFADNLEESIVSVSLLDVIARLNETIEDPENNDIPNEVRSRLQNEILILESLQDKLLTPMVSEVKKAAESLRYLFRQQKDLAGRVEAVAKAAEMAQEALQSSGAKQQVRELARDFEGEFVKHVEEYSNFTYISIRDAVGHCQPLFTALNATTATFCHKIGAPLSAFWFSLTCLLIIFLPLIIIGMILARLYKKYKYLGYDRETYYSTYGDGDTIPLSLSANGRRQKRGRAEREPQQPQSAASRFPARFEDTSQKINRGFKYTGIPLVAEEAPPPYSLAIRNCLEGHGDSQLTEEEEEDSQAWGSQLVFNNHHTPPTSGAEYERPPPYYYPGPAGPAN